MAAALLFCGFAYAASDFATYTTKSGTFRNREVINKLLHKSIYESTIQSAAAIPLREALTPKSAKELQRLMKAIQSKDLWALKATLTKSIAFRMPEEIAISIAQNINEIEEILKQIKQSKNIKK